jgi:hypothetical protein
MTLVRSSILLYIFPPIFPFKLFWLETCITSLCQSSLCLKTSAATLAPPLFVYLLSGWRQYSTTLAPPLFVYLLSGWRQHSATLAPPLYLSSLWLETVFYHTCTASLSIFSLAGDSILPHLHCLSVYLLSGWRQYSTTLAPPLCLSSLTGESILPHLHRLSVYLLSGWRQ